MRGRLVPVALAALLLAGCGFEGAQDLPLPGAIGGDDTYAITIVFPDAANLVPKETCRTSDTVVGSVESVTLDEELRAVVVCRIKDDVVIPGNATATLSESSLLGERFVALDPPAGVAPVGRLEPDASVSPDSVRVDPDVELVLGSLSQILNGGSLGALQTITGELTTVLSQADVKGGIRQLASTMGTVSKGRSRIDRSLVSLDRLAKRLSEQRDLIGEALVVLPEGLAALERQRPRFIRSLRRLSALSKEVVPLIDRTRDDLVADLEHLTPTLRALGQEGDDLALTLERLGSFPFPSNAMSTLKGDYAGAYANLPIDIDWLNELIRQQSGGAPPVPDGPLLPLPGNPGILVPPLPEIPGLPKPGSGELGGLLGLLGLSRSAG
ncbi:MAG TPA: MlaD family protein [Nocardioidaceae bacterium]|nr:MlaD family protein [Nocardioidaceae bacterium]